MSAMSATATGHTNRTPRPLRAFADPRSYKHIAFLLSALPLAGVWLALLIVLWVFAITPLVVPVLIGASFAVRGAANVEAWLARLLLDDSELILAPSLSPPRAWAILKDRSFWARQAYLVARMTLGFGIAVGLLSSIGVGIALLLLPAWFWAPHQAVEFGVGYHVDTFLKALSLAPVGFLILLVSFELLAPLARLWRTLCRVLLTSPQQTMSATGATGGARSAAARGARRALLWHSLSAAGINLFLILIWALTSHGYFWPIWTILPLGLPLAIHAWVVWANENRSKLQRQKLDHAFALHAGIWGCLLLFLTGVWAASSGPGGYFWPVWPLLGALLAVGAHAAALLMGAGDRSTLTARISALETSRAGAVDVQEAELRRIERDLHDGAQARLVALGMSLGMAEQKLAGATADPDAARVLLAEARAGAGEALRELRDLARGIHPPVLADRGLDAAVRALAAVSPVKVTVSVSLASRPKAPVESAAYFVVAESLANAGKHAHAGRVDVRIGVSDGRMTVEIRDDGVGGANANGSGLQGLRRRVEALDGRLLVVSPPGGPTTVRAELPCE
jgi:signal transduction histidine kinase